MLISPDFFDQLCPSYKNVIKELDDNIFKLESESTDAAKIMQQQIIEHFSANYMMPKEYWQFYERFDFLDAQFQDLNKREKKRMKAYKHFYFNRNLGPLPQVN
uniref:Uncharacterized protein n=1 Tax=Panagrolaimus superbus TaxID=310955 RepID=A0A914Y4G3_9BILA